MELDLGFLVVLGTVLGTIFFLYFLVRRALTGFKRGYEDSRRDR
ncbi:MAG: hypothetical protein ABEJ43_03260 [Haloferacaceae archaeon]